MRLVEGVGCELPPVGPDLVQHVLGMAVLYAALYKLVVKALKNVYLLLTHGLTELVRLAFGEACHLLRDTHYLLLIYCNAVGLLKEFRHYREVEFYFLVTAFAGYKRRDIIHRPRSVKGVHCYKVLEALRMQALQPFLHSGGLELEHALGVST